MCGVPKIWDVIKKGAQAKIAMGSPVAQWLVAVAFAARGFAFARGFDTPFLNALVFKKFSGLVGGKLRLALSGGGPLNTEVQKFVRTAFGCPLFQGYGLTETCAGLSIQDPLDMRCGIAGAMIPTCEVRPARERAQKRPEETRARARRKVRARASAERDPGESA
jgi:long-chain acyl-CoA synthetase